MAAAVATLAGCATAPPAAVTVFAGRTCASAPDLAGAVSLTPNKAETAFVVTTRVDGATPCLTREARSGPYVVYALPADREGKVFTIGSVTEEARLVPPSVSLLDRGGKITRTFAPSDLLFRGPVYSVQVQPRPEDAYVLVTTDSERVGQKYQAIAIGTSTAYTGYGGSWTSGVDRKVERTFSYEGSFQVTVYGGASSAKH
jgi:hypothetical protein